MSRWWVFCLLFILSPVVRAQGERHGWSADVVYHHGYMLPEYAFINYLVNQPVRAVEMSLYKRTTGRTLWEQLYRYPDYGLSVMYSTLGNHDVFGEYTALFPWYRIHFIDTHAFSLYYRLGVGLCYVDRVFDPEHNYRDRAIGSRLNIFFNLETGARILLYRQLWLTLGTGFNHLSNANLKEPNFGLNDLTFYGGFSWTPTPSEVRISREVPEVNRQTDHYLTLSAAPRHVRSVEGNRYLVSSLSFDINRRLWHKVKLGAGADLFYDSSTKTEMETRGLQGYRGSYDYRSGIHLSQEFMYDRLSLIFQEGRYVFLGDHITGWTMYTRGIIQFRFTDHLMARLSMKSHFFVLDHPELGIGYRW